MYNERLMQVFARPKNVGIIKGADAVGEATNSIGEISKIYITVKEGVIVEAKFKAYGSATVIASSSVLTVLMKGKTIDEAINITKKDIISELGNQVDNISSIEVCIDAMLLAIKNFRDKD